MEAIAHLVYMSLPYLDYCYTLGLRYMGSADMDSGSPVGSFVGLALTDSDNMGIEDNSLC